MKPPHVSNCNSLGKLNTGKKKSLTICTENKARKSELLQLTDRRDCWSPLTPLTSLGGSHLRVTTISVRSHQRGNAFVYQWDKDTSQHPGNDFHLAHHNLVDVFWNSACVCSQHQQGDDCYRKFHLIYFCGLYHNLSDCTFHPSESQRHSSVPVQDDPSAGGSQQQDVSPSAGSCERRLAPTLLSTEHPGLISKCLNSSSIFNDQHAVIAPWWRSFSCLRPQFVFVSREPQACNASDLSRSFCLNTFFWGWRLQQRLFSMWEILVFSWCSAEILAGRCNPPDLAGQNEPDYTGGWTRRAVIF